MAFMRSNRGSGSHLAPVHYCFTVVSSRVAAVSSRVAAVGLCFLAIGPAGLQSLFFVPTHFPRGLAKFFLGLFRRCLCPTLHLQAPAHTNLPSPRHVRCPPL